MDISSCLSLKHFVGLLDVPSISCFCAAFVFFLGVGVGAGGRKS